MTDLSPRLRWPIPAQDSEPYYEAFLALIAAIDASTYGPACEDRNLLLTSSAIVGWDAGTGVLTWSAPLDVLSAAAGFLCTLPSGSVTLADGQLLYTQLTRAPVAPVTLEAAVASTVALLGAQDALVLAFRRGARVYWRNGRVLGDGESIPLFDANALTGLEVQSSGSAVGTRAKINFTGMVSVADNPGSSRVDITVPSRGTTGQTLLDYVPVVLGKDTDSVVDIVAGHLPLDKADHVLEGTSLRIEFYAVGYCSVAGVTGQVTLESLDGALASPVVLTWTGVTDVTALSVAIHTEMASGPNRYRIKFAASGSSGPAERFFLEWAGFRIIRTVA